MTQPGSSPPPSPKTATIIPFPLRPTRDPMRAALVDARVAVQSGDPDRMERARQRLMATLDWSWPEMPAGRRADQPRWEIDLP